MADDEEVVELNMPRPRSISKQPQDRKAIDQNDSQTSKGEQGPRRQSDAQQLHDDSLRADTEALDNIARDLQTQLRHDREATTPRQEATPEPISQAESLGHLDSDHAGSEALDLEGEEGETQDAIFQARMRSVDVADIEAIQRSIRSDRESSIQQASASSAPSFAQASGRRSPEEIQAYGTTPVEAAYQSESPRLEQVLPEIAALMAGMQLNPTSDQQYVSHRGSRGISPPPGFDDASIPPYQDSSTVPPYANVVSQPAANIDLHHAHDGTLSEAERPSMTDKFMNAHIARHGAASLSPLALLTPDQADTLPVYAQSGTSFLVEDITRGRDRTERPAVDTPESREIAKAKEAVEAVRAIEEREALEAIEAVEAMRAGGNFDERQVAAMQALGDTPSNYFSPEELMQYQRIASEPDLDQENMNGTHFNDEAELLQMMAQYARRSPPYPDPQEQYDPAQEDQRDLEEFESMLRDRSLTQNQKFPNFATGDSAGGSNTRGLSGPNDPDILAILEQAAKVSDQDRTSPDMEQEDELQDSLEIYVVQSPGGSPTTEMPESSMSRQPVAPATEVQQQQSAGYGGGHHVKRTTMDPSAYSAQQARNAKKAASYMALEAQVVASRQQNEYSRDAFDLTTKLLLLNPEYYSVWNYRREILLCGIFPVLDVQAKQDLLSEDLKRLQAIMRDYPKVYWIWTHRKWCLAQCPWPDWSRELLLVTKMLEQDARNFHVWEYRRYVIAQIESAEEASKAQKEFDYTTAAINSNFSNFSAWHNRTKLVPKLLFQIEDGPAREDRRRELLQKELELIKGAIYTDPDDQSVWLYHRWLLNPDSAHASLHPLAPATTEEHVHHLNQELTMISELMEEEPDNVWCTYAKVDYGLAVQRLSGDEPESADMDSLRELITVLENNDNLRKGRYQDWHASTITRPRDAVAKDDESSSLQPQFAIFADLKSRNDWSQVTLNDSGHITALRNTSSGELPCTILPSWKSMHSLSQITTTSETIVADTTGHKIRYFHVSEMT